MEGAGQGLEAPRPELSLRERLELYSRKPVQIECERFAQSTEEWDLSVSGRLEHAAKLCEAVREYLDLQKSA